MIEYREDASSVSQISGLAAAVYTTHSQEKMYRTGDLVWYAPDRSITYLHRKER